MENRQLASAWWLIVALVIAALAACADDGSGSAEHQLGQGVYVGADWSVARAVSGHRLHVVKNKIECTKCHELREHEMGPVTPFRCAVCHEREGRIEHASEVAERQFGHGAKVVCTMCHAFTLDGTGHDQALLDGGPPRVPVDGGAGAFALGIQAYEPGDCKRCHELPQGRIPAVVAHRTQQCLACHKPHETGAPQSAPCTDCHKEIATTHASHGKGLVETCKTCHQHQHAPAEDAVPTCVQCHSIQKPIIPASALFEGGHTQCVGCHRPHDFEPSKVAPCRTCHEQLNVLGGARVAAHNTCTNCHSPHDVKASPEAACPTCHTNVHPDHPKRGVVGTCVGCHDPHPNRVSANVDARACSSCHQFAHSDQGAHEGVACTGCHKPHHFGLELANLATCTTCHSGEVHKVSTNAGHQACQNCHRGLPHRPEALQASCDTCHGREQGLVNTGHGRCTQCHEPHSGAQGTACGVCHKNEQHTAPTGHQACTKCHEPHAGLPVQKTCSECHAAERQSPHGQVSTGCLTCHRPHGPSGVASPPGCTTCHAIAKLPGLHAETKHQTCTRCHAGHGDQPGTARQTCLECHTDRKDHFPNSPRCANCHLFTHTQQH